MKLEDMRSAFVTELCWSKEVAVAGVTVLALATALTVGALAAGERLDLGSGEIAYETDESGRWNIYLIDVATGNSTRLTRGSFNDWAPTWSPDGRQLAFYAARDGELNADIFVIDANGSGLRNLTGQQGDNWRPAWSPDGRHIAFMLGYNRIRVMDSDGQGQRHVTFGFSPTWSPDGRQLAFYWDPDGRLNSDIYVINLDGSNRRNLTRHPANDWNPAWSPDGTRIAFVSARDGNAEIYVMNSDGTDVHRLTYHTATDTAPSWSADGRTIAFESEREGNAQIYLMEVGCVRLPEGCDSHLQRLTHNDSEHRFPVWRPT